MIFSLIAYLFGGYWKTGWFGRMYFVTERGAYRYGKYGLSAIDPYVRGLDGPIVFQAGKLCRKTEKI